MVSDTSKNAAAAAERRTVRLNGISKSYGAKIAVEIDELSIRKGEFLTLLGPSGCGKTTLLLSIAGFVRPDSGKIHVDDRDITSLVPEKRNFGMVFQGYALFPHLSVRENVAFPLRRRGVSRELVHKRTDAVLEKVQMNSFADRLPRQLSGGQQQRVALARAIVFEPDLVLLDEPLSALDTALRHELQSELKSLHRETGMTFVCVTHDQDEALSMSDRIAVMRNGRIVQLSSPQELYSHPKSRFVANFMGAKNILTLKVGSIEDGKARCLNDGQTFIQNRIPDQLAPGDSITIAIRPGDLKVGDKTTANNVSGTVRDFSFFGSDIIISLTSNIGPFSVKIPASQFDPEIFPGASILVGWNPDDAIVVIDD